MGLCGKMMSLGVLNHGSSMLVPKEKVVKPSVKIYGKAKV